jgi:hypothetical protein
MRQRVVVVPVLVQLVKQSLCRAAQAGAQARWGGVCDAGGLVVVSFALNGAR